MSTLRVFSLAVLACASPAFASSWEGSCHGYGSAALPDRFGEAMRRAQEQHNHCYLNLKARCDQDKGKLAVQYASSTGCTYRSSRNECHVDSFGSCFY